MPPTTPTNIPTGVPPTFNNNQAPVTPPPAANIPPVAPPPSYTPPQKPVGGHGREASIILPALLVVLLIGAGYYWYASRTPSSSTQTYKTATTTPATSTTPAPAPNVTVVKTDLATAISKLPAGFPANIPVDATTITESYKASYSEGKITQYTVSYTSAKSKDDLWKQYTDFATANGYKLDPTTSKTQGMLDAKKTGSEINVVITKQGTQNLVQLSYLERR